MNKRILSVVLVFVMILSQFSFVFANETKDYEKSWAKNDIIEWLDKGYITTYEEGNFKPKQNITRAEFVQVINKAFNIPQSDIKLGFNDIKEEDLFYKDVASAKSAGYIGGYPDGTFKPNGVITRQEAAKIIAHILNIDNHYKDVMGKYKDSTQKGLWAQASVNGLVGYDIVKGYPDGTFGYNRNITRAEALVMIKRSHGIVTKFTGINVIVTKQGAVVEGAKVNLFNGQGALVATTVTNQDGIAQFKETKEGRYYINSEKEDFLAPVKEEIIVREGFTTLQEVEIQQAIQVEAVVVDINNTKAPENTPILFKNGNIMTVMKGGKISGLLLKDTTYDVSLYLQEFKDIGKINTKNNKIDLGILKCDFKFAVKTSNISSGGTSSNNKNDNANDSKDDTVVNGSVELSLLSDNGTMVFAVKNRNKKEDYKLYEKHNDGEYNGVSIFDHDDLTTIEIPSTVGLYAYRVVGNTDTSNEINYLVTNDGAALVGLDSDGDGLEDELELILKTDPNNADTDSDGLPDGYEYYILGTDPLKADTNDNGINDGAEDTDGDGLTNLQEYQLGTNPLMEDTDGDGLNDGEEVNTYKTNPLVYDTDGDGLSDYEEILLGFDPLNRDTNGNGTLDGEEKVKQTILKENMASEIFQDNDAIPEIIVKTNGYINNMVGVSPYSGVEFGETRSIIGKPINIKGIEAGEIELTFKLADSILAQSYVIAGYDEEGETVFYETSYDELEHSLCATVNKLGCYFVLDVAELFNELGFSLPEQKSKFLKTMKMEEEIQFTEEELESMQNTAVTTGAALEMVLPETTTRAAFSLALPEITRKETSVAGAKGQADIVFIIDTTGSMGGVINNVKSNIIAFIDVLKERGVAPSFALIDFQDITYDGLDSTTTHKNGNKNWFADPEVYKTAISQLKLGNGGDTPETPIDGLETARLLDMRGNANKFFILVTDANYKVDNRYGITSMAEEIELLKSQKVCTSVITSTWLQSTYADLVDETSGIFANINNRNFNEELMVLADKISGDVVDEGVWIYLKGAVPIPVKLKELPVEFSLTDSDGDGIPDCEELESVIPLGQMDLDNLLMKSTMNSGMLYSRSTYGANKYGKVNMYGYKSNPGIVDTDGDGYSDEEDLAPKKKFMTPVVLLHGRTSDTYETFGAVTKIQTGKKYKANNGHYGKLESENGKPYEKYASHEIVSTQKPKKITSKQPTNLAYEMEHRAKEPYVINKNLFAFNYPNLDMTSQNGLNFEAYLENLADYMKKQKNDNMFYPTKESRDNKDYKVNLIGHSNGGLVSRYFIENLGNSNVVDKLITIDTPHFGSGFATVTGKVQVPLPIDVDLSPENQIFGGTKVNYGLNGSYVDDRVRYINKNQTQELKYWNHGTTKYYFIAGYDAKALSRVPIEYLNKNMPFELDIDYATTFGQYKDAIKNSFIKNSEYGDLADDDIFKKVFDLKYSYGDNVVNNQSQLGLVFESDKENGKVEKKIKTQGKWMNIDTHMGDWVASHFHGDNQHRTETINQVFKYLK